MANFRGASSAVDLDKLIADRQLVITGAFKDEIARLTALKEEAQKVAGVAATMQDAAKLKKDAETHYVAAGVLREEADKVLADANAQHASVTAALKVASDKLNADIASANEQIAKRDKDLQAKQAVHEAVVAASNTAVAASAKALQEKADAVSAAKSDLETREKALADRTAEIERREKLLDAKIAAVTTIQV